MLESGAEIWVRVTDLAVCRVFYRDILGLGVPLVDSNFLCIFQLGAGSFLTLEPGRNREEGPNAPWLFLPEDPEELLDRLYTYGCRIRKKSAAGRSLLEVLDPEQNPVYLTD